VKYNKTKTGSPVIVLGIDPGETTGICLMYGSKILLSEQLNTKNLSDCPLIITELLQQASHFAENFDKTGIEIACEDYRVYAGKSDAHKMGNLHTAKLIGIILALCWIKQIPIKLRMAGIAKGFVTDAMLHNWEMYNRGNRHARDAMRHAIYHQVYGFDAG
jgi:hypothetical protein